MTKEALKKALEALVLNNAEWKHLADSGDSGYWSAEDQNHYKQTEQAIAAVQRALANEALDKMAENARELGLDYEPAQEPVAWAKFSAKGNIIDLLNEPDDDYTPLYTTPPQRKPLTDEEIQNTLLGYRLVDAIDIARAIESAHGIKG